MGLLYIFAKVRYFWEEFRLIFLSLYSFSLDYSVLEKGLSTHGQASPDITQLTSFVALFSARLLF